MLVAISASSFSPGLNLDRLKCPIVLLTPSGTEALELAELALECTL